MKLQQRTAPFAGLPLAHNLEAISLLIEGQRHAHTIASMMDQFAGGIGARLSPQRPSHGIEKG